MNKSMLRSEMAKRNDTQETLARALGLSVSRVNAKINEKRGAEFTQSEIWAIKQRYNLHAQAVDEIFFSR